MGGLHILTPTFTAGATVTSNSNAGAAVAASNLVLIQQSRKWRSAGLTTLQVTIDAGEVRTWDTVSLLYHTITSSGTIRVTSNASTGTLFSAPSYDSGTQSPVFSGDLSSFAANHFWFYAGTPQSFRYIGLQINDGTNPDGFIEAGVVMAGAKYQPAVGPDIGSTFGMEDPSEHITLVSGETIVRPKRQRAFMRLSLPKQREADVYQYQRIFRTFGTHTPAIYKWDTITTTYQQERFVYGYIEHEPASFAVGHPSLYDVSLSIKEV